MAAPMAVAAAAAVAPLWQSQANFVEEHRVAEALQAAAMAQSHAHHDDGVALEQALHRTKVRVAAELHGSHMQHVSELARREAVRDMWGQRNQLGQTLMVVGTVLWSCAFGLSVEAPPPTAAAGWLRIVYAATLALALAFLFVSLWAAVKLQARLARYDMHTPKLVYACGRTHRTFGDYFDCHCAVLESATFASFFVGAVLTVAAGAWFMTAVFTAQRAGLWGPAAVILASAAAAALVPLAIRLAVPQGV